MCASARPSARAIADFQALQFRLADMATELEAARMLLWRAAAKLDAQGPEATMVCAMAKRFATDTGFEGRQRRAAAARRLRLPAEYGIEKIVRDLRVHQILEGTNEIMRADHRAVHAGAAGMRPSDGRSAEGRGGLIWPARPAGANP